METTTMTPETCRRMFVLLASAAVCLSAACGCARNTADRRADHATRYVDELSARTAAVLSTSSELTLDDCVRIALDNNLALKSKEINSRLAALERQAAFSAFLPTIELEADYVDSDHQQAVWTGSGYLPMSDKAVTRLAVTAAQPVFLPRAWLFYSMRKNSEDIARLVEERAREIVTLRVTSAYFACLSFDRATPALETAAAQARSLAGELRALEREGLVMRSDLARAEALLAAREAELASNRRAAVGARAALLNEMGLAPLAPVTLGEPAPLARDARELPDQILAAMRNRPELYAADRAVEASDTAVRAAIADFLPSLLLVGSYTSSTDGYLRYSDLWSGGVRGVLTVFDGFSNVARYRAARAGREEAYLRREEACVSVMLEVLYARLQSENASESARVAEARLAAAESALAEAEALAREDMVAQSARLDSLAERDAAQAQAAVARYREQVARATLADVIGKPREEKRR